MPAFVRDKLRPVGSIEALALEFAIVTGVRSGDVLGQTRNGYEKEPIRWSDLRRADPDGPHWMADQKTGEYRIALCSRALDILAQVESMKLHGEYVFPSVVQPDAKLGKNAMQASLADLTGGACHVHGFRTSFRTWADRSGFDGGRRDRGEIAECVLSHKVPGDQVSSRYRDDLLDLRLGMMDMWAGFLGDSTPPVVVPFRRQAA